MQVKGQRQRNLEATEPLFSISSGATVGTEAYLSATACIPVRRHFSLNGTKGGIKTSLSAGKSQGRIFAFPRQSHATGAAVRLAPIVAFALLAGNTSAWQQVPRAGAARREPLDLVSLIRAADSGDPVAQTRLGEFQQSRGQAGSAPAAKWYRRAADQGYAPAQYRLGLMYADGRGVQQSASEAEKWLRRAANQHYAPATVALSHLQPATERTAQKPASLPAATKSEGSAQTPVVLSRLLGAGSLDAAAPKVMGMTSAALPSPAASVSAPSPVPDVLIAKIRMPGVVRSSLIAPTSIPAPKVSPSGSLPPTPEQAFVASHRYPANAQELQWLKNAAEAGDVRSQSELGTAYAEGKGTPRNYTEAVRWLRRAAERGDALAQGRLAFAYSRGLGVPRDEAEAARWLRKAAEQDLPEAQYALGKLYSRGRQPNLSEARAWFTRAADRGYAPAQLVLAMCDEEGKGAPQDYRKAVAEYRKAAEQGLPDAQYRLGLMYEKGRGVQPSLANAEHWFRQAAQAGSAEAQYALGRLLSASSSDKKNRVEAYAWFANAATAGLEEALPSLNALSPQMTIREINLAQARALAIAQQYRPAAPIRDPFELR